MNDIHKQVFAHIKKLGDEQAAITYGVPMTTIQSWLSKPKKAPMAAIEKYFATQTAPATTVAIGRAAALPDRGEDIPEERREQPSPPKQIRQPAQNNSGPQPIGYAPDGTPVSFDMLRQRIEDLELQIIGLNMSVHGVEWAAISLGGGNSSAQPRSNPASSGATPTQAEFARAEQIMAQRKAPIIEERDTGAVRPQPLEGRGWARRSVQVEDATQMMDPGYGAGWNTPRQKQ